MIYADKYNYNYIHIQNSQSNPVPVVTPSSESSSQNNLSLQSSLLGKLQRVFSFFLSHDKLSEKSSSQTDWPTQRANTDSKQTATITLQCCLHMLAIAAKLCLVATKNKLQIVYYTLRSETVNISLQLSSYTVKLKQWLVVAFYIHCQGSACTLP